MPEAPQPASSSSIPPAETRPPGQARLARLGAVATVLLVAALSWLFLGKGLQTLASLSGQTATRQAPAVNSRPPAFALPTADGQTVVLASFDGRPVIVNFWATWCQPCRTEMPVLESAYQHYQADGLAVLAVNLGDDREEIVPYGRELGLSFPLLMDPLGRTAAEYGVVGLPTTFFIDRQGRITHIHHGPLTEAALEQQLSRILR